MSASILRRAGIGALVVSISAGMTSNLLFLEAFQFRLDRFLEPTLILGSGAIPGRAVALGVSPGPVWLLPRHGGPRVRVVAAAAATQSTPRGLVDPGAVGYALAGWAGAAVLAMVAPMLMQVLHALRGDRERGMRSLST